MNFCKLYEDKLIGQVLVKIDEDMEDDREELRIFYDPGIDGLAISSVAVSSKRKGFAKEALEKMTEEQAVKLAKEAIAETRLIIGGE
jgi:hypothetical protein